ncbi:DNRLRE domain-containing protein [Corallococcus exercitus]|uniref:DNRLRE domain-containing protein n=1 Tax=Corallococcus exercitus TaxID=2316736 RepID=A0A3A8INM2_9BACT|nr:DNRLRE domain-containing protein [Corallococcus exercitus]NOK35019.1 DNRLRE domain-containing protein [Corallococcus exercitus]RKG78963.1 DNRLRE domain-containing protein [Corallococcus exercitus]
MQGRAVRWGRRSLGWLSALVLCTHCGGVAEQEQAGPEAAAPPEAVKAAPLATGCISETIYETFGSRREGDAYVDAARPTTNFGNDPLLLVDGSPQLASYMKFSVTNDDAYFPIVGATLNMSVLDGSTDGPALYRTSTGWSEDTLTWNTRPAPQGDPLGDLGNVESNTWVTYDVSAAVRSSGEYAFALLPTGGNGVDIESEESRNIGPMLNLTRAITYCSRQGTGGALQGVWKYGGPGEEMPSAVAAAPDGGWVVAARFYTSGDFGGGPVNAPAYLVLAKYGPDGSHQWSRSYVPFVTGGVPDITVGGLAVTSLGNILIAGSYSGSPDLGTGALPATYGNMPGVFIAKYSPNGTPVWSKGFLAGTPQVGSLEKVPARALAVATDASGSLIVTGRFSGQMDLGGGVLDSGATVAGREALFVARFSWEGQHLWSRVHGAGNTGSEGQALATDSTGAVLLAGVASPHPTNTPLGVQGPRTPFVAKYSPTGALQWSRALNGGQGTMRGVVARPGDAVAFTATFTGSFPFAGRTYSASLDDPYLSRTDIILGALSAYGSDQWGRQLGDPQTGDRAFQLGVDGQGRLTLRGDLSAQVDLGGGPIGHPRYVSNFVSRYAADGSHLWSRGMDPNLTPVMAVNSAGETMIANHLFRTGTVEGTFHTANGPGDLLLLKLAP